ncbi:dihydrolipoyl dehydrogenase [Sulfobacillus harzensis]|uniref:Dihydrolipoyl dehydrogenase n=1 Tax=Sulfobacillus harzensis TaxID=2729629 RepID=A0A7Y0L0K0_9FIRM|nr:dihydrolipoyl dehydrogenase [Sulfobacillus harzensis]NMP21104.1 dihydrolipoyl dehydrogenase [Sulfobacillus harzensis]
MVVGEFTESADLVVIGGGPGGYVAAIRAAQLGRQVTLVERGQLGGICLNVGCIPSKALITVADEVERSRTAASRGIAISEPTVRMEGVQRFKTSVVERLTSGVAELLKANGVTVIQAEARFVDPAHIRVVSEYESKKIAFESAIVATGSRPNTLSMLPVDQETVLDSTGLLALQRVPEHLVVVGGGYIGLELGTAFRKFGSRVTVVEALPTLLSGMSPSLVRVVERRLRELGVEVMVSTRVVKAEIAPGNVQLTVEGTEAARLQSEAVLVTVGRTPNTDSLNLEDAHIARDERGLVIVDQTLKTQNPRVAAIGDIVPGPMLAHKASYEGKVAAESLSGLPSAADATAVPAVIFTDPEMASVGMTEEQAREAGYQPLTGRFSFAANGRALSLDEPAGFAEVVADQDSGILLGLHAVGREASNLIAEGGLALEMGATLEDVALTIHAHPTLPEVWMEAAEVALGRPIHVAPRRRR